MLNAERISQIINKDILLEQLETKELAEFCILANDKYRQGSPIISDSDYDFIFLAELKRRNPEHDFLQSLENENISFGNKLLLPFPMLSTDKAYSYEEIIKFCNRLIKAAEEINLQKSQLTLKATPKLDGFAAFDDGKILYTRGDGRKGSDISRVFDRGLKVFGDNTRGLGAGEIVVSKSYFNKYLADNFEHPRNFTASIIKEKELDNTTKAAIDDEAAFFVPFVNLPQIKLSIEELLQDFDNIVHKSIASVDFDADGVIIESTNQELKDYIGSNRKFHRWQIAFKENKESRQVKVISINPQVGRTGKITPVAILDPVVLSGANITHATCHHYGMVKQNNLGAGSVVELIRSGQVIPKIDKVLKSTKAIIPFTCPSCQNELVWQSDFLICINHNNCPDQIIGRLEHFFKVLGNNDGFGIQTIRKIYNYGVRTISEIYRLTEADLQKIGFGEKTSYNLTTELENSKNIQIEDYRFLSAFGVDRLGLGNSENLLKNYAIADIFSLTIEEIAAIDGFALITARSIINGLNNIKSEFMQLFELGFNLEITKNIDNIKHDNFFSNQYLLFSGKMTKSREEMEKQAKDIGANVQKSVNKKTNFLIIGKDVGQSKINKARELNIKILTESEYLAKI